MSEQRTEEATKREGLADYLPAEHEHVDHMIVGRQLHRAGYCLSEMGDYEGARAWYERAAEQKEQGDVHGRVDHTSLGSSLHAIGFCISEMGDYEGARAWYERAAAEAAPSGVSTARA